MESSNPWNLAHLPYRKRRTFEDYISLAHRKRLGKGKGRPCVADAVKRLKAALQADYVLLGRRQCRVVQHASSQALFRG